MLLNVSSFIVDIETSNKLFIILWHIRKGNHLSHISLNMVLYLGVLKSLWAATEKNMQ